MTDDERETLAFLTERKKAYQLAFTSPAGIAVMADLTRFCRGKDSCFHPDPRTHAALEGRREVYLRIMEHLDLTPEQLFERKTQRPLVRQEPDNQGDTADD